MQTARRGSDLKIHISLALHSLGQSGTTKGKSTSEMEAMLSDLRKEQIKRGIIRVRQNEVR